MSRSVLRCDCHPEHHARHLFPLSGRQGAVEDEVTRARKERTVDTIAVARKLAKEQS